LATVLIIVGTSFAVIQWRRRISNSATLKVLSVGVYKDVNFTVAVTQIDWGILEVGETKNFSAYIKNESNVPITLTMWTEDWNPTNASSFINVSWNYNATQIPVQGDVPVTFILHVSPEISDISIFSFTIVLVGSG